MKTINDYLKQLYPDEWERVSKDIDALLDKWKVYDFPAYPWVNSGDAMMITYGDAIQQQGKTPIAALDEFIQMEFGGVINLIHLLPMFPYSSDDGFSVVDFRQINPGLGIWDDIGQLNGHFQLMFDAVLNHASVKSEWFKGFLEWKQPYRDYFTVCDPDADYSQVVRPRTSPLLTKFETADGDKWVWTTFSDDQADLNYKSPALLLEMLDILLLYASRGARFVRFDAIGFSWKEQGTGCMHLPQVHTLIKLMRAVLQSRAPGCTIITETNVPHEENISYFGNGDDEAALVYQFPLPPLVLYSFLKGDASQLSEWAGGLEPAGEGTTFFNFLASHDGIGMRPVEDILPQQEKDFMAREVLARGGEIGYRTLPDGSETPYELNINYLDAIAGDENDVGAMAQKFLASQCILLSMDGMPGIYYHSLLGSRGWREGYEQSGIKRRINRQKLDAVELARELAQPGSLRNRVANGYKSMLAIRKGQPAFNPGSGQRVLRLSPNVFALQRGGGADVVYTIINVSGEPVAIDMPADGTDLITGESMGGRCALRPWQYCWVKPNPS